MDAFNFRNISDGVGSLFVVVGFHLGLENHKTESDKDDMLPFEGLLTSQT